MQDILKLVGSKIRDYRKSKGLSQDQLGELCGFHFSYIGGVERGERNLSLENIGKIAKALDVEPKLLFEFGEPFLLPVAEEKEAALQELLAILKGRDISHIRMSKHILVEIFNSFPSK
ncbi:MULTISPECIES: helix-turn-helix domain-containing protein [unclassified Paenibacillus]|uniref:helix-turn-helix domain-containing protein n=1 Tax=unclassified Paenibacillus TaxID=185978 RepID=UPI003634037A